MAQQPFEVHPEGIFLRRPLSQQPSCILTITNPNALPIAFRVRTTHAKDYITRPNSGRIEPRANVLVEVRFCGDPEEPKLNQGYLGHKFLIQTHLITPSMTGFNPRLKWEDHPKHIDMNKIYMRKLKVFRTIDGEDGPSGLQVPISLVSLAGKVDTQSTQTESNNDGKASASDADPSLMAFQDGSDDPSGFSAYGMLSEVAKTYVEKEIQTDPLAPSAEFPLDWRDVPDFMRAVFLLILLHFFRNLAHL